MRGLREISSNHLKLRDYCRYLADAGSANFSNVLAEDGYLRFGLGEALGEHVGSAAASGMLKRKAALAGLLAGAPSALQSVEHFPGDGATILN